MYKPAELLPDSDGRLNLQIIGIKGMWTTLYGELACIPLSGPKAAAAVSRIEGQLTMVAFVCQI